MQHYHTLAIIVWNDLKLPYSRYSIAFQPRRCMHKTMVPDRSNNILRIGHILSHTAPFASRSPISSRNSYTNALLRNCIDLSRSVSLCVSAPIQVTTASPALGHKAVRTTMPYLWIRTTNVTTGTLPQCRRHHSSSATNPTSSRETAILFLKRQAFHRIASRHLLTFSRKRFWF